MLKTQVTTLIDEAEGSTRMGIQVRVEQYSSGGVAFVLLDNQGQDVCDVLLDFFDGKLQVLVHPPGELNNDPEIALKLSQLQKYLIKPPVTE